MIHEYSFSFHNNYFSTSENAKPRLHVFQAAIILSSSTQFVASQFISKFTLNNKNARINVLHRDAYGISTEIGTEH